MAGEKILCVDDEDPIRKLCMVYLGKRGYRVEAVANGIEALKVIESKGAPDLVVTDVNMPLMNGLELVKRLREDRRTASPWCCSTSTCSSGTPRCSSTFVHARRSSTSLAAISHARPKKTSRSS